MKNLLTSLLRIKEINLAKKVLSKIERKESKREVKKSYNKYNQYIISKGYRPHVALKIYLEGKFEDYLTNFENNKSYRENQSYEILKKLKRK